MPFLPRSPYEEEQLKKQQEQGSTGISGTSTSFDLPGANQSSTAPKPTKTSGAWTNLNQYLNANKEQAGAMGSQVAGKITDLGEDTRKTIKQSTSDFNSAVDSGTINNIYGAEDDAKNTVNQARSKNASGPTLSDDQLNRFKEVTNATYKGPDQLTDTEHYKPAYEKTQKVNQYSKFSENDDGRQQLLKEVYARPTYSQGQSLFDNLLLSGSQDAKNSLQNARQSVSDVQGIFDKGLSDTSAYASDIKTRTNQARDNSRAYTNSEQEKRNTDVQARLDDVNSHWNDEFNQYRDLLNTARAGGNLDVTQTQADRLGVGANTGLYNVLKDNAPETLLTQKAYDANKLISKDEQAQLAALDILANQYNGNQLNRYKDADQAGTLGIKDALDTGLFQDKVRGADTGFNDYAGNTTVDGYGTNEQSWYGGGLFNNDKHWVSANSRSTANLADYLSTGNLSVDSKNVSTPRGTGSSEFNPVGDIGSTLDGFVDTIGGDVLKDLGWGGGSAEANASRDAKAAAINQGLNNYYSNLQKLLDEQGYANRVKIK